MTSPLLIVIVGPNGRKRENLVAIAASVSPATFIMTAETCAEAQEFLLLGNIPALLLIDYCEPGKSLQQEVVRLIKDLPRTSVVLLKKRLHQLSNIPDYDLRKVLYDDVSKEVLLDLIAEVEKESPQPTPPA